jgi:Mg-chelatase subunit ChlD
MKNNKSIYALAFTAFLMVGLFQNCSKTNFVGTDAKLDSSGNPTGVNDSGVDPTCSLNNQNVTVNAKVLFLVDTSGSNATGNNPSDPNKVWRLATLNRFINQYQSKSNFYVGLVNFAGTTAASDMSANFSNSSSVIQQGVMNLENIGDNGNTPYKAALAKAKQMISAELSAAGSKATDLYAVVMISDGMPTDYKAVSDMNPDLSALMALAPGRISLNSVFYYGNNHDASQVNYLKAIAQQGQGAFIEANSSGNLNISDVIQVPSSACQ